MKKQIFIFLIIGLLALSWFSTLVLAASLNITINETGKIISFYDEYFIYQIDGSIVITNPSNNSLYNIEIPLYLSTLDIRTNYSKQGNYLSPNELFIYSLGPGSTETFNYELIGISTEDLSTDGDAVLANAIQHLQPKIYSNLFGTLQKAQMEDSAFTGRNARLISVEMRNPTDFEYTVEKVEVIKTTQMDPNAQLKKWVFTNEKVVLEPFENWAFDFIDENATEGEIYWLTTDVFIETIDIFEDSNISRYDQEDLFELISNVTPNVTINDSLSFLSDRLYLRKFVSSTLVFPGDIINITLFINNLKPKDVSFQVFDVFPQGFEIISVDEGTSHDFNVSWNVTLSSGFSKRLRYQIRYTDKDSLGLDYFKPAYLFYEGKLFYSQTLPFIRKYIPQKRLFVQKNIEFLGADTAKVTISLQNLGESALENIMIKEYLLSTAEFREISKQPLERGLWKISILNQSTIWDVTYVTDKMSLLNNMPEIYGIAKGSILQTIILSNVITSHFYLLSTNIVEIIGVVLLVLLLILYFVPPSYFSRTKKQHVKDLQLMTQEIGILRRKTDRHNQSLSKQKISPVLKGEQTIPQRESHYQKKTGLYDPKRVARHNALEKTAEQLDRIKDDAGITDEKEEKKKS